MRKHTVSKELVLGKGVIEVLDNLVDPELIDEIWGNLMSPVYSCVGLSNKGDQFPFWVVRLDPVDLEEIEVFGKLWKIVDDNITKGKYEPYHTLVNANNFGDCPMVHTEVEL